MINSVIQDTQFCPRYLRQVHCSMYQHQKKKKKYAVKIYEAQASSYYQPNVSNIRIGIIQYHLITT